MQVGVLLSYSTLQPETLRLKDFQRAYRKSCHQLISITQLLCSHFGALNEHDFNMLLSLYFKIIGDKVFECCVHEEVSSNVNL